MNVLGDAHALRLDGATPFRLRELVLHPFARGIPHACRHPGDGDDAKNGPKPAAGVEWRCEKDWQFDAHAGLDTAESSLDDVAAKIAAAAAALADSDG